MEGVVELDLNVDIEDGGRFLHVKWVENDWWTFVGNAAKRVIYQDKSVIVLHNKSRKEIDTLESQPSRLFFPIVILIYRVDSPNTGVTNMDDTWNYLHFKSFFESFKG